MSTAVLAGTDIVIGLAPGMAASVTATKILTGAAFQVILYVVGTPVVPV